MESFEKYKKEYEGMIYWDIPASGNDSLPPLLILHGWMQNKETWKEVIEHLSNCRIICPDLPGFGESDNPKFLNFSPEDYTKFLNQFLLSIDILKVSILGHSYGGRIAVSFAASYPENISSLIIYSSPGMEEKSEFFQGSAKLIHGITGSNIFKNSFLNNIKDKVKAKVGSRDYKASGEREVLFLKAIGYDVRTKLSSIKCAVLIIWGDQDEELSVKQAYKFQNEIKNSKIEILKGYGHFAHISSPILFAKILNKFLNNA